MKINEVKFFSEKTGKFYKLVKTATWPTIEISGIHMHRIKDVDPRFDSILKIKSLGEIHGIGLDCCTGLGYTAILAARRKNVKEVITVEKDKNVIKIARYNPFSRELFNNQKIKLVVADIFEIISGFPKEFFNFIVHDPPRISIAGELYSLKFYEQLYRVLKKGGKLFHYIGEPGKKRGKTIKRGVILRLKSVGFRKMKKVDIAKGVVCVK